MNEKRSPNVNLRSFMFRGIRVFVDDIESLVFRQVGALVEIAKDDQEEHAVRGFGGKREEERERPPCECPIHKDPSKEEENNA